MGVRVFVCWINGLYYCGFVINFIFMIVFISYDDGDIIMLYKIDLIVVIFDYFVCYSEVYVG